MRKTKLRGTASLKNKLQPALKNKASSSRKVLLTAFISCSKDQADSQRQKEASSLSAFSSQKETSSKFQVFLAGFHCRS